MRRHHAEYGVHAGRAVVPDVGGADEQVVPEFFNVEGHAAAAIVNPHGFHEGPSDGAGKLVHAAPVAHDIQMCVSGMQGFPPAALDHHHLTHFASQPQPVTQQQYQQQQQQQQQQNNHQQPPMYRKPYARAGMKRKASDGALGAGHHVQQQKQKRPLCDPQYGIPCGFVPGTTLPVGAAPAHFGAMQNVGAFKGNQVPSQQYTFAAPSAAVHWAAPTVLHNNNAPVAAATIPAQHVMPVTPPLKQQQMSNYDHPDNEIRQRPRWETPRRRGEWKEDWQCAKELCEQTVTPTQAKTLSATVRTVLSQVVLNGVSLARATVDKWLKLLTEFLELNVDEHLLLLCLIRKYLRNGHSMVSQRDYSRPQRWECVIGIACYFAVMLSEEFPGRTALDLRDLLGGNFCFGREQVRFLGAVDWRINVSSSEFEEAQATIKDFATGKIQVISVMSWLGVGASAGVKDVMSKGQESLIPTVGSAVSSGLLEIPAHVPDHEVPGF